MGWVNVSLSLLCGLGYGHNLAHGFDGPSRRPMLRAATHSPR